MTHQVTEETRKFVENAAGMGLPHEMIATLVGVKSDKTLRKKYRRELDQGKAKACLQMATCAFQGAIKGDAKLVIWWTKTQMKWKEDRSLELSTPPGRPLELAPVPEPELIGEYYARLAKLAAERRPHSRPAAGVGAAGRQGPEPDGGEDAGES